MNGLTTRFLFARVGILSQRCLATSPIQGRVLLHSNIGPSLSAVPSTNPTVNRSFSSNGAQNEHEIVLYERSPGNLAIVKSGFGFSCFHSIYWVWYAVDFVPTVNAAAMTQLHVDPMIPIVGVVFAGIVQAIFTGYPLRLVSKLGWRPASREFTVYTHTLPLIRPSLSPRVARSTA